MVRSDMGLKAVIMPRESQDLILDEIRKLFPRTVENVRGFDAARDELLRYFDGEKVAFGVPLDWSDATPFQRKVWEATASIPWEECRSYLWVAQQIDKPGASRAVGQALAANPLPVIVPCHRVVSSNGGLGGYSGGLEMKKWLLALEGTGSTTESARPSLTSPAPA